MRISLPPTRSYFAYYRVSTQKQGASELGLGAQRAAARVFVAYSAALRGEYVEIESSKKNHRPSCWPLSRQPGRGGYSPLRKHARPLWASQFEGSGSATGLSCAPAEHLIKASQ
jgi:hypothetical protein